GRLLRLCLLCFCLLPLRPRRSPLFPYTTLFRSFVRLRWSGEDDARVLRPGRQTVELGDPPSTLALVGLFLHEGALHLVTGYDHRSEEHTSELQSRQNLVCRLLLEKKNKHYSDAL